MRDYTFFSPHILVFLYLVKESLDSLIPHPCCAQSLFQGRPRGSSPGGFAETQKHPISCSLCVQPSQAGCVWAALLKIPGSGNCSLCVGRRTRIFMLKKKKKPKPSQSCFFFPNLCCGCLNRCATARATQGQHPELDYSLKRFFFSPI